MRIFNSWGAAKPFPFLALPGEVRNKIYEYAAESISQPPTFSKHPKRRSASQRPLFLGLTQVCRQIRTEYLPLYRSRTIHIVGVDEATKYIDTFFWAETVDSALLNIPKYEGTFYVQIPDYFWAGYADGEPQYDIPIDILPLLRFAIRAPRFDFHFMSVEYYPYTKVWHQCGQSVFTVMERFFSRSATSLLRYLSLRPQSISHILFSGTEAYDYDWISPLTLCLNEREAPDWLKARCAVRTHDNEEVGVTIIEGDEEGVAFLNSIGIDQWVETNDDVGDYRCSVRLRIAPVDRDIIREVEIPDWEWNRELLLRGIRT
jgi:hypothetical protein